MKRIEVYAVGILLALVPAVFGLWGNASFSRAVPVRVPDQARASAAAATQDPRGLLAAEHAGRTAAQVVEFGLALGADLLCAQLWIGQCQVPLKTCRCRGRPVPCHGRTRLSKAFPLANSDARRRLVSNR